MPLHFEGISPGLRSLCFIANSYGWINRSPWLKCSLWHLILMRTTVSLCLWCCVCVSSMPASRGSCPIATPASSCLRLRDRTHMMVRWDQMHNCIHTHTNALYLAIPLSFPSLSEEEESGDDEGDIITRAILKHQSQLIIDSKTKRKTRTKKKKGKLWS